MDAGLDVIGAVRRRVLPARVATWSLTSLQQRLVKTGGRLIKHARYYWLLLPESPLTRRLVGNMLRRIARLPSSPTGLVKRRAEPLSMTTLGRREKCRRNRWETRHFRALHDRARQNWLIAPWWKVLGTQNRERTVRLIK